MTFENYGWPTSRVTMMLVTSSVGPVTSRVTRTGADGREGQGR